MINIISIRMCQVNYSVTANTLGGELSCLCNNWVIGIFGISLIVPGVEHHFLPHDREAWRAVGQRSPLTCMLWCLSKARYPCLPCFLFQRSANQVQLIKSFSYLHFSCPTMLISFFLKTSPQFVLFSNTLLLQICRGTKLPTLLLKKAQTTGPTLGWLIEKPLHQPFPPPSAPNTRPSTPLSHLLTLPARQNTRLHPMRVILKTNIEGN